MQANFVHSRQHGLTNQHWGVQVDHHPDMTNASIVQNHRLQQLSDQIRADLHANLIEGPPMLDTDCFTHNWSLFYRQNFDAIDTAIDGQLINFYQLYVLVNQLGGIQNVGVLCH